MCYYISGCIKKNLDLNEINKIGIKYGIKFQIQYNKDFEEQISIGKNYISKESIHCDCNTSFGSITKINEIEKKIENKLINLKKKGWSSNKIKQWSNSNSRNQKQISDLIHDADNWINYLKDLLSQDNIFSIGLFLHWYNDDFKSEEIKIKDTKTIKYEHISRDAILNIEEDTLYFFNK